MENTEDIISEIIQLYEKYGDEDYDGEPVSQSSHMIQCAMLAMEEDDEEVTIGAFLHDIGHLLKHEQFTEAMGNFGVVNHEKIGAAFLRERGFSEKICAIVENHVAAKRYLVATDESYADKLSLASRETLKWQGGAMNIQEQEIFKSNPFFDEIIKVRLWDEKAKDYHIEVMPLGFFEELILNYLNEKKSNEI